MDAKRFLVIGMGSFGSVLVTELLKMNRAVTAVDEDRNHLTKFPKHANLDAIIADATDRDFLESLDVKQYRAVMLSTGEDSHSSILITMHLRELGAERIIVKANTRDHARILEKVGATETVIPEQQMAAKLAKSISQPNLVDFLPLSEDLVVAEIKTPESFVGKHLSEVRLRSDYHVQAIAVKRNSGTLVFVPGGDFAIHEGDLLVVVGSESDLNRLRS
ncbi:MAG: TrkA family potassium uptake protein [candidate division Zixibacteria bacterium]|nr:TrkA family potassium uptake protein [candidate division Zixibacteria bacterium]